MPSFTLAQIQTRVYDGLDNNTGMFPELNVRIAINQGIKRVNLLSGYNQSTVEVPGFTRAGQLLYTVPSGIVIPLSVSVEQRELGKISLRQLGEKYLNWAVDTTATKGPTMRWAAIGILQFVIHPIDATGGRLLEVSGVAPVPLMVNQSDVVTLPDEFVDMVVDYARQRVMLKLSGKPFADASLAYNAFVAKIKTLLAWQGMTFQRYWLLQQQDPASGKGL